MRLDDLSSLTVAENDVQRNRGRSFQAQDPDEWSILPVERAMETIQCLP